MTIMRMTHAVVAPLSSAGVGFVASMTLSRQRKLETQGHGETVYRRVTAWLSDKDEPTEIRTVVAGAADLLRRVSAVS